MVEGELGVMVLGYVFPVSVALSGSGLIAETQKFKLDFLMTFFSTVVLAVSYMSLALIYSQLYFRQPVDQCFLDLFGLLMCGTMNHHIICIPHKAYCGIMVRQPFIHGKVKVKIGQ